MNFNITSSKLKDIKSDLEIIIVIDKNLQHKTVKDKKLLKKAGFTGSQDELCHLIGKKRLYVGAENLKSAAIRAAVATAMRSLTGKKAYKTVKIAAYVSHPRCSASIRAIAEGAILGSYTYTEYKSKKLKSPVKTLELSLEGYEAHEITMEVAARAVHNGEIAAEATNYTRNIVNTPPDDFSPESMAKKAKKLAKELGLGCDILNPKALKKEKMHMLLAVARASRHDPYVIHLSHKPKHAKKVITLVGKGLTYDSGGLSLKPGDYMVTMKADKSGASAVIGIMKAIAEMNLPIEVHGFLGMVENMIGGDAYKPDDVLTAKNGKTIEVRNTDAEGRLVLADVLCYAQQEVKADYIFDLATLTGACVVGVGHYTSGIMGFSDEVKALVGRQAKISGELATALDFNPYLAKTIKSDIADLCNISNTRYGGAVTAGLFLSEFIDKDHKEKWAHIDIAGPAFVEHIWGENPSGASGAGVRMVLRLLESLAREQAAH
ncbi:leucyl aminopeptidase [Sulfurovum sp.]|uniref:leucyl aminopeptidase n=1 Tax=Sulfurovum sp. TaxID=1969726 RepID=UPI002624B3E5|nr:leucyl aminopeptidase [Sulfurovum sp.]